MWSRKTDVIGSCDLCYRAATFNHPQSQDYIEYKSIIQITDSGKQPITIQLEFTGIPPFAPMPPDKHIIKASNLIELYVKLERLFHKRLKA